MAIKLGTKVKDPITGAEGTAIGKTDWLYGCTRIAVQMPLNKDGKVPDMVWFDEPQLEGIPPDQATKPGGPQADPAPCNGENR
jgi:hypothetical protein